MQRRSLDPRVLALVAVMTPIVFLLTSVPKLFLTPDKGYIHLGDAGIFFSAFAFGPIVGAVAGWLARRWTGVWGLVLAALVGAVVVVAGYFLAGIILSGIGAAALAVPLNILQVAAGMLLGVPLYLAIRQAYPPITRLNRR